MTDWDSLPTTVDDLREAMRELAAEKEEQRFMDILQTAVAKPPSEAVPTKTRPRSIAKGGTIFAVWLATGDRESKVAIDYELSEDFFDETPPIAFASRLTSVNQFLPHGAPTWIPDNGKITYLHNFTWGAMDRPLHASAFWFRGTWKRIYAMPLATWDGPQ